MRVLVVGPGAVGTLLAVDLAGSGHVVTVVVKPHRVDALARSGLRVEGDRPRSAKVGIVPSDRDAPDSDAVLVAVKTFDLPMAIAPIARLDRPPTLLIQNGLDVTALASAGLARTNPAARDWPWVRAVTSLPATGLGPGAARAAGTGWLVLAADPRPATETWATLLRDAGVEVRRAPDLAREEWRKLLVNAAINPVTAMHGVPNGELEREPWRGQALGLLDEALAVAEADGQPFDADAARREVFEVVRASRTNRSSMLQDLDRGRPTEIEAISGAILARGRAHGLELPRTARAVARIRAAAGRPNPQVPGPVGEAE